MSGMGLQALEPGPHPCPRPIPPRGRESERRGERETSFFDLQERPG